MIDRERAREHDDEHEGDGQKRIGWMLEATAQADQYAPDHQEGGQYDGYPRRLPQHSRCIDGRHPTPPHATELPSPNTAQRGNNYGASQRRPQICGLGGNILLCGPKRRNESQARGET